MFLAFEAVGQAGWSIPTMRLAHHLLRHRSGVWHFRLIVPRDLQATVGLKVIKKSLGTRDVAEARMWAYMLGARYAQIFGRARESDVPKTRLTGFEIEFQTETVDGSERLVPRSLKTDGSDKDNAAGLEALKTLLAAPPVRRSSAALDAASPAPEVPRGHRVPSSKVAAAWLAAIKEETLPKTHQIKRAAVEGFVAHFGGKKPINEAMREDVSAWIQALRSTGVATATLANKAGYLTAFFDWCVGQGYCAPFQATSTTRRGASLSIGRRTSSAARRRPATSLSLGTTSRGCSLRRRWDHRAV